MCAVECREQSELALTLMRAWLEHAGVIRHAGNGALSCEDDGFMQCPCSLPFRTSTENMARNSNEDA